MQREIEALIRSISTTAGRRTNVQAILQEILYAIQRHDMAIDEADQRLLEALDRAIAGTQPAPQQQAPTPKYAQDYVNTHMNDYQNWKPHNG